MSAGLEPALRNLRATGWIGIPVFYVIAYRSVQLIDIK